MTYQLEPTVSGTAISSTNKIVDGIGVNHGLNGYPVPNFQTTPSSTRSASNNQVFYTRFYAPANITITKIAVYISAASSTSTDWADFGIYNTSGTLLASTGQKTGLNALGAVVATLGSGTGALNSTATYTLTGGTTYYVAALSSISTGTVTYAGTSSSGGAAIYGTTAGQWLFAVANASGTPNGLNAASPTLPTVTATTSTGTSIFFVLRTD